MRKLSFIIFLSLFSGTSFSYAQETSPSPIADVPLVTTTVDVGEDDKLVIISPPENVRTHYLAILDQLFDLINKKGGVSEISWVNVPKLAKEIHEVRLLVNTSKEALIGSGTRAGSIYLTEQKTVILNSGLLWEITRDGRHQLPINVGFEVLLLHEFLGALGYPDDNYELSSYLWIRSEPDAFVPVIKNLESTLKSHLDVNTKRTLNVDFDLSQISDLDKVSSGGSSGFGGGGDPTVALIKHYALGNFSHQIAYWTQYLKLTTAEAQAFPGVLLLAKVEPKNLHVRFDAQNHSASQTGANAQKSSSAQSGLKARKTSSPQEVFQIVQNGNEFYFIADTERILNAKEGQEIGMISYEFMAKTLAVYRHLQKLKTGSKE